MTQRQPLRRDAGMSLVEIMIALVVVGLALVAMVSLMLSSNRLQDDARERSYAYNAARSVVEEMRGTAFASIFDSYKSGTPLNTFTVDKLGPSPVAGAPQGRIEFPERNGLLAEDVDDVGLGTPKDLNQDGDATDAMGGADAKILPVRVVILWTSPGGRNNRLELASLITEKR